MIQTLNFVIVLLLAHLSSLLGPESPDAFPPFDQAESIGALPSLTTPIGRQCLTILPKHF